MVNLSLTNPITPQKENCNYENQEKVHEPIRIFNCVRNDFHNYLRSNMLRAKRWLGIS